jgi:F-type H+-transporting ATPase subunit a
MIEIGYHAVWQFWGMVFNSDTVISSLIVSLILVIFAFSARFFIIRKNKYISGMQAACELLYVFSMSISEGVMGAKGKKYASFIASLFIFILVANVFGILPVTEVVTLFFGKWFVHVPALEAPTADINTTAALALTVFFSVHFFGIRERGLSYFKRYFSPNPVFLPLNLMEELAKPLSLAIRLFGNTFGKATIVIILVSLMAFPLIYPIPFLALGLFIAFVQAYIFALLTTFYIASAISEGH